MYKSLITALVAILMTAPVYAESKKTVIMPEDPQERAFLEQAGYSRAVLTDDYVFMSGLMIGPAPGETDLKPGYDRAFKSVGKILERAGVGWSDVVDITTYHTDMRAHIMDFAEVKHRYIKAPFPAWTAIGGAELFDPTAVVEMKIIARRPDGKKSIGKGASPDAAGNKVRIRIEGFECGDNCYLDFTDLANPNVEIQSALCRVGACEDWFSMQEMPPGFIGRSAKIILGTGKQYDNAGNVMSDDFPEVTAITIDPAE